MKEDKFYEVSNYHITHIEFLVSGINQIMLFRIKILVAVFNVSNKFLSITKKLPSLTPPSPHEPFKQFLDHVFIEFFLFWRLHTLRCRRLIFYFWKHLVYPPLTSQPSQEIKFGSIDVTFRRHRHKEYIFAYGEMFWSIHLFETNSVDTLYM